MVISLVAGVVGSVRTGTDAVVEVSLPLYDDEHDDQDRRERDDAGEGAHQCVARTADRAPDHRGPRP